MAKSSDPWFDTALSKWHRSSTDVVLAGVCAGVAETYGVSAKAVRVTYCAALIFGLPIIAIYLFQWLTYPVRPGGAGGTQPGSQYTQG
ncbi:hypothetical protein C1Y63_09095 [Corynebacterium sp. 13CS0277]|uniref:PspC domain-containing protein n=1 Tax=Corynebacterium sp. 13CS0277 TaxID=2071994 RepID=UPI000D0387FF|nr:PspC domain-containing protein [Corynebacterium sp. 13CS0277]PRQ10889.1 hypothetical protein C1Y63_09095 [Corynebacterium sp. 13CS0277]